MIKRVMTGASGVGSASAAPSGGAGDANGGDPAYPTYPEWSDLDIQQEKWSSKVVFEDPEGMPAYPKSMRHQSFVMKRMGELLQGEGGVPSVLFAPGPEGMHLSGFAAAAAASEEASEGTVLQPHVFELATTTNGGSQPQQQHQAQQQSTAPGSATAGTGMGEGPIDGTLALVREAAPEEGSATGAGGTAAPGTAQPGVGTRVGSPVGSLGGAIPGTTAINATSASITQAPLATVAATATTTTATTAVGAAATNPGPSLPKVAMAELSKFLQVNQHLLHSPTFRQLLLQLQTLVELYATTLSNPSEPTGVEEQHPWECIYPKNRDGNPMHSPSGKYYVRLFWMGAWRRVTVDDRIPIEDRTGRVLLVTGVGRNEVWPLLLSKALLKLAAMCYNDTDPQREMGEFDFISCLKGRSPERLHYPDHLPPTLWPTIQVAFAALHLARRSSSARSATQPERPGPLVIADGGDGAALHAYTMPHRLTRVEEGADGPYLYLKPVLLKQVPTAVSGSEGPEREGTVTHGPPEVARKFAHEELRLSLADFCARFRHVTLYHHAQPPANGYKFTKALQGGVEMRNPADALAKPPQILYLPPAQKRPATILVRVASYGRIKRAPEPGAPRGVLTLTLEEYNGVVGTCTLPVLHLSTTGQSVHLLHIPAGAHAYRMTLHSLGLYHVWLHSKEHEVQIEEENKYLTDTLKMQVKEVEDAYSSQPANGWSVFFRYEFRFAEPTYLAATLQVPVAIQSAVCLRAIDNDTMQELPKVMGRLIPHVFKPNKAGYLLMADCRSSTPRTPGRWRLRLVSNKPLPPVTKVPGEQLIVTGKVQDFEDLYTPNRHYQIFRQVLKVKDALQSLVSIQLQFSLSTAWITLQLYDLDTLLYTARGKGVVTIPAALLQFVEEPVPVAPPVEKLEKPEKPEKPEKSEKKSKGDKKGEKEKEKEKERRESVSTLLEIMQAPVVVGLLLKLEMKLLPKHRYILVAKIDPVSQDSSLRPPRQPMMSRPTGPGVQAEASPAPAPALAAKTSEALPPHKSRATSARKGGRPNAGAAAAIASNAASSNSGSGPAAAPPPISVVEEGSKPHSADSALSPGGPGTTTYGWKVRVISSDAASVTLTRDTEREDRYVTMKAVWEAKQHGRAAKAREAREAYIRQVQEGAACRVRLAAKPSDPDVHRPWEVVASKGMSLAPLPMVVQDQGQEPSEAAPGVAPVPAVPSVAEVMALPQRVTRRTLQEEPISTEGLPPALVSLVPELTYHVLTPELREAQTRYLQERIAEFERVHEDFKVKRLAHKEERVKARDQYVQRLEEKMREVEGLHRVDMARRDAYRAKLAKAAEEAAAAKASELASLKAILEQGPLANEASSADVVEAADKVSKKKAGKK